MRTILRIGMVVLLLWCWNGESGVAVAQGPTTNQPWAYVLLDGSYLIDDCPICGRPTIEVPMRGRFSLRLIEQNLLSSRYAIENMDFKAGDRYTVKGSGTYEVGGEVALRQKTFLQAQVNDGLSNKLCFFTNSSPAVNRTWPMLDIVVDQTNGTFTQVYHLRLAAAPIRDIWFSTTTAFTTAHGQAPTNRIGAGDLLSFSGQVIKRNDTLIAALGIMPPVPDVGLDAVDVLPGGEIAFSVGIDVFSETLGPISHGDLLSSHGQILARNADLLSRFTLQPPAPDAGLDAVQVLDGGQILFSIETNVFSEALGVTLGPGDLLSNSGMVWRSRQKLLSQFRPMDTTKNYGLDAVYVWPNGEIWFSTETGFQDLILGAILPGDLLSDAGYVVFRNLDLLDALAPLEDMVDFGLDALFVVTDATPPAAPPGFQSISNSVQGIELRWKGAGRVFQVERATALPGPFSPVTPVMPDLFFLDPDQGGGQSQVYYRLLQW